MKILIFSNLPSPYFVEYLNELGKYADVIAVFERKKASDRDKSWGIVNAKNFKYFFLKGLKIGNEASLSFGAKKYIKLYKDRIIIFGDPTTPTGILGIRFCKKHKISYCVQSEGGFARVGNDFKTKLKKYLFSNCSLYLTGMKPSTDYFYSYGAPIEKIKQYPFSSLSEKDLIKKPVSIEEKEKLKKELGINCSKMILYVGSMIYRKGVDLLLNSFKELSGDVCLYCIGGESTKELSKIIKDNNIKNAFFIAHSNLNVLKKYYRAADLFVLPTRYDTWGLVVNEAMAYGLPVVTTKNCVAGLQLIEDGKNGYLVESESLDGLTNAIQKCLDMSNALKMPVNNIEKIKNYTFENMGFTIFNHLKTIDSEDLNQYEKQ